MATKSKPKNQQQEQTGRSGFSDVAKLMRDSFRYTICSNEESNHLITTLDDVIYSTIITLDKVCPVVRNRYMKLVQHYTFHPVDGWSSYSSKGTDTILLSSLFWTHNNEQWLATVRNRVSLFRLYWMDLIHDLNNVSEPYLDLVDTDIDAEDYIEVCEAKIKIETYLCASSDTAYGIVCELKQAVKRMERIVRKLTYPYLRKVVTHARRFSNDNTNAFMENYQNGSVGIRIAIGRHDCQLGAFASTVDRWINNRIMTFIRDNGMLVKVPDRAFTHKNIVDKHLSRNPLMTLEEIADKEGIKSKLLIESMNMVQSQTGYIDLGTEDESTSKHSHEYIDRSTDPDCQENTVKENVREYTTLLKPRERVLLSIAFGIEDTYMTEEPIDPYIKKHEQARQLLALHHNLIE